MALSEDARIAAGDRFRAELEAEHQRRHEKIRRRQEKARSQHYRKASEKRQVELYELQENIALLEQTIQALEDKIAGPERCYLKHTVQTTTELESRKEFMKLFR